VFSGLTRVSLRTIKLPDEMAKAAGYAPPKLFEK
jgi:hypothetical protein